MLQPLILLLAASMAASTERAAAPAAALVRADTTPEAAAEAKEAQGDLAAARDAWLALAPTLPIGAARDAALARVRFLDGRLALRAEIQSAAPLDPRVFAELGIDRVDTTGIVSGEKRTAWNAVTIDLLRRAAAASRATRAASNGVLYEALARGSASERQEALVELGKRLERGEVDPADAFAAVARARNEPLPARGYVYRKGEWTTGEVLAAKAQAAGLEEAALRLEKAAPAGRDAALAALAALGPDAEARLHAALDRRLADAVTALTSGTTLTLIAGIADARKTLDLKRKHALDLIFDEERYFYPYNPPECPPEKGRLYAGVQQEVDESVARVRDAWKFARRASMPEAFRAALLELDWNRSVRAQHKFAIALPGTLPPWLDGLDRHADVVDLKTFAWDAAERAALRRDAEIDALNARLWQRKDKNTDEQSLANGEEQEQVRVTNEYRRMLGRCVLAWNPRIQVAAQGHSDWMSLTGTFGHFETEPERRTPVDRLRLAGYTGGGSENCSLGATGAEGAHVGWLHSSGHHRNILVATHREMASAIAGIYWTQNFGAGREYEHELSPKK
jgi:uncharacterized protein YkwD